jgi:hypothetical protein
MPILTRLTLIMNQMIRKLANKKENVMKRVKKSTVMKKEKKSTVKVKGVTPDFYLLTEANQEEVNWLISRLKTIEGNGENSWRNLINIKAVFTKTMMAVVNRLASNELETAFAEYDENQGNHMKVRKLFELGQESLYRECMDW